MSRGFDHKLSAVEVTKKRSFSFCTVILIDKKVNSKQISGMKIKNIFQHQERISLNGFIVQVFFLYLIGTLNNLGTV